MWESGRSKEERWEGESDRSERQMNVFLNKLFSVNYARYSSIILENSGRVQQRAASQLGDTMEEHSHSPLAARESRNVNEAAKTVST